METSDLTLSFLFALALCLLSLLFYMFSAWVYHSIRGSHTRFDFNLGIPDQKNQANAFALSLVASSTSLSTVFVFFLTAGVIYGQWVIISPLFFVFGNILMFYVYRRLKYNGYFSSQNQSQDVRSGLIPFIGYRLSGKKGIGWLLSVFSLINLLSLIVLELIVGVEVLGFLVERIFNIENFRAFEFIIFIVIIILLYSYVLIGGFRAVIASDIWQMKAMKWAIFLTVLSLLYYVLYEHGSNYEVSKILQDPPKIIFWGFVINVVCANMLSPMSQEASWQRFIAYDKSGNSNKFDLKNALRGSVSNAAFLWGSLIVISYLLLGYLPSEESANLTNMSNVLSSIQRLDDWWFPYFIFPVLTMASLSAMFSTTDTNISAILYLLEYSFSKTGADNRLPKSYYFVTVMLFLFSIGVYFFVRVWFEPTILQLVFSVFSNLVIIAPSIACAALFKPLNTENNDKDDRYIYILISLLLGFVAFWSASIIAMIVGESFLWLSQLSILIGLVASSTPIIVLYFKKRNELWKA